MMKKFNGKKEKWANKGNDKQWVCCFLNASLPSFVPNFKILREICDGIFPLHYIGERDGKTKRK